MIEYFQNDGVGGIATLGHDAKPGFDRTERVDIDVGGHKLGTLVRAKSGEITITIAAQAALDPNADAVESAVVAALRKVRTQG